MKLESYQKNETNYHILNQEYDWYFQTYKDVQSLS